MVDFAQAASQTKDLGEEPANLVSLSRVGRFFLPKLFQIAVRPWKEQKEVPAVLESELQGYEVVRQGVFPLDAKLFKDLDLPLVVVNVWYVQFLGCKRLRFLLKACVSIHF
jgi:hypothetical protein